MPTLARKTLSCAALALLAANLPAQTTPASAPRDPRIDAVLTNLGKVRAIHQTAISPDGKLLAWVVAGEEGGKRGGTEIEVAPLADPEKTTRATAGSKGALCEEGDIAWSPDSKTLAFLSDCQADGENKGQRDFYLYQPEEKSAPRRLTHLHGIADEPAFSPDGKQLGFLYVEGATRFASPLAAEKPPAGVIGEDGLEIKRVAEVSVSAVAEPGQPNRPLANREIKGLLSLFNFITPANLYVYEFDWSPDSKQIAYIAAPPPGENNWWVAQLYTQPIDSAKPTSILDPANTPGPLHGLQIAVPRWSPDGKQIAFIGGLMSDQGATGGDIYVVPSGGGPTIDTTPTWTQTPVWLQWITSSKLFVSAKGSNGSERLLVSDARANKLDYPIDLEFEATFGDGRLEQSVSVAQDGTAAFVASSFANAPAIYIAHPLATIGMEAHQITHYNDALKPSWGKSESITWTSAVQPSPTIPANDPNSPKDFHVQGWLLYPADYDPAKKYPLVVYVHGGPSSATLPRWPSPGFGPAPFAALGYFVLMPNPRGSYGQGEAFTQANRKDFGYGDLRDILAAIDPANANAVIKTHNIDPQRVGLTGWSYGGFMTMFAVTQTNRFRAAVAGAGISDWQSYYGENSIDQWMIPFFGASVYDDPQVYAKMSAINFIKQVKTPTLAVVGDRDGECPAPQSFEFWHALKAQHVPTQLVVYPNEGHHFVDPEHQRDVLARALDWFQKYMPARD
jgi:dipeptidyl aminopeptidase/acylaminoacyl peptidase